MKTIQNLFFNKKTNRNPLFALAILFICSALTGCFKDFKEDYLFTDFTVEFDVTTWESGATGKSYPVLGPYEKGSGIKKYKVNLIGKPKNTAQEVQYRIVADETTAIEGTHFKLADAGRFTIEANGTTGEISIEILDFPAESGIDTLVVELINSEEVKVSQNYKRLGLAISLVGPPSESHPLHNQLGPDSYNNSIFIDLNNPALPNDVLQRIQASAVNLAKVSGGPRILQNMYLYFGTNNLVTVVARYFGGGGNSLVAAAYASWTYKMELDDNGVGRLLFVESNGNGTAQRTNFFPILDDYLGKYEFKVAWVDPNIANPPRAGKQLGGLFRTDDNNSFILGTLEDLQPTGSAPMPQSSAIQELFSNGSGGYFTTLLINPDGANQSAAFKTRWQAGKAYIEGLAGRKLHKMMFYFNPNFNFQDIRLINYYYTASAGQINGQIRYLFNTDFEGKVKLSQFVFQDANGAATRAPELVDNFLMITEFKMTRTGNTIRFTSTSEATVYFEGELGNNAITVNEFWPE